MYTIARKRKYPPKGGYFLLLSSVLGGVVDQLIPDSTKGGRSGASAHRWIEGNDHIRVIKRQFGYTKVRFRGLVKNTAQLVTLFALSNLWMTRRHLMEPVVQVRPQYGK